MNMRRKRWLVWIIVFAIMISTGFPQTVYGDSSAVGENAGEVPIEQSMDTQVAAENNAVETIYVEPKITWTRTKDDLKNTAGPVSYVNDKGEYISANGISYAQHTALTWNWSSLDRLIKDEVETQANVWDYAKNKNIRAAYFNTGCGSDWADARVHKISGVFQWPEGYDLHETTITLESVNDTYYQELYEYISDNKLDDLFPLGKVFPVNDDVYVVMWAEDGNTKITAENINDYLLFWTGTSGKGIWSQNNNVNADWARTTPATFISAAKQGVRAFHYSYPNAVGIVEGLENANVLDYKMNPDYLEQTDGWYTLTDTTAINSVMRNNYPKGIHAGQTVHLDLYCFNNSSQGGIDELKIGLSRQQETETTVQVQYYYGSATNPEDQDHYLGSSVLTNQKYGQQISLLAGTKASQLDYMKAAAIVKAGNKEVTGGVQVNDPLIVTEGSDNIIYVVYTAKDAKIVYLKAPSDSVQYDGNPHTLNTISVTEKGWAEEAVNIGNGKYTLPDGNTLGEVYSVVTAVEPGKYNNNFKNPDGKESFCTVWDPDGHDITGSYTFVKTPGTLTITYEPDTVDYTYDFGETNLYTDFLNEIERKAEIAEKSEEVTISEDKLEVSYKPAVADTGDTVELILTFTGNYQVKKIINFIPATNVLYEENFIKKDGNDWNSVGTEVDSTIKDNGDTIYGYTETDGYKISESFSNGSADQAVLSLTENMTAVKTENAAEFTFTGSGFDLISACGTDTGMLVVRVEDRDTNETVKAYVVDTYFSGDMGDSGTEPIITGEGVLDYQVPVVRNMNLPYGNYKVTVYGYLNNFAGATIAACGMDTEYAPVDGTDMDGGYNPTEEMVMTALLDCGVDDVCVDDVEVVCVDENSILNGGTGICNMAEPAAVAYSLEEASEFEYEAYSTFVYLDGFRVYKPLKDDVRKYEEDGEASVTYASVYDFIKNSAAELTDWVENAFVYVEYDGDTDVAAISEYKIQGPQNEVYLTPGSGIAFALDNYAKGDVVQLSMKSIPTKKGMSVTESISKQSVKTGTEMYYKVTPKYDRDSGKYIIQVVNSGTSDGILSVSGIKISSHIQPMANTVIGNGLVKTVNRDAAVQHLPKYVASVMNAIFEAKEKYFNFNNIFRRGW